MRQERQISHAELERMRKELSHSNEMLQLTQKLGRIGTWVYDLEKREITWSDEVYRLYQRDPVLGPPSVEEEAAYYSKEQGDRLTSNLEHVLRTGQPLQYDIEVLLPDGEKGFFTAVMYPGTGPDGTVTRLIGTVQDIGERITTERKLKESEAQYRDLFEEDLTGDFVAGVDGTIRFCNRAFIMMFGFNGREDCSRMNITDLFQHKTEARNFLRKISRENKLVLHEQQLVKATGEEIYTIGNYTGITNDQGELVEVKGYVFDTTSKQIAEQRRALITDILKILNRPNNWRKLINDILARIKSFTGYKAIGIRLREEEDFPYFEATGFTPDFIETERSLCSRDNHGKILRNADGTPVLDCMCGRIISGKNITNHPVFTAGGSFWTNRVSELTGSDEHVLHDLFPRGKCIHEKFESIALIPLKSGDEIIGLLQFTDHRPERFTLDLIHFYEELGNTIGLAFQRVLQEKLVRENEEQFRMLFHNAPFPRWVYDVETLEFLDVNHAAIEHYGYSREEFLSMTLKDIRPQEEVAKLVENVNTFIDTIQFSKGWHHRKKDGTVIDVEITSHAAVFNGRKSRVVLANDVTQRNIYEKEIHEKEELLSSVVDNLPVGVWITDMNGHIIRANKAGQKIWGGARYVGKEEYGVYKGWWRANGKKIEADDWAAARAVTKGETSVNEEIEIECFDGTRKIILNSAIPLIADQKIEGAVIVNQDITEQIKNQELVIEANRNLEREKHRAEESNRIKTSLLNNLSHEFRTPMNAILGFSSIIMEDSPDRDTSFMARRINGAGDRLMKTLDDILELAQMESYTPEEQIPKIEVVPLIEKLLTEMAGKAEKKGLTVLFHPSCRAEARINADHLIKAITHLIDNAIKFTDQGNIEIQVEQVSERRHRWVEIRIKDEGVGIPKEHQQVIFEAFRQASEGYGRTYEGTGLGLTIANRVVSIYGGHINLVSDLGQGSTFTICLPREETFAACESPGEPAETRGPVEKNRVPLPTEQYWNAQILVVEDNQDNVDLLQAQLQDKFKLSVAYNGKNALEQADKVPFDLILMDINLGPDMNGLDVTRILRKKPGYDHVPIIAVTGYTSASDKNMIFQAGCSHYLGKPFTQEQLLQKIMEAVSRPATKTV